MCSVFSVSVVWLRVLRLVWVMMSMGVLSSCVILVSVLFLLLKWMSRLLVFLMMMCLVSSLCTKCVICVGVMGVRFLWCVAVVGVRGVW